jgi:hypothetical protein
MPGPGSSTQIDNSLHSKESSHEPEETEIYYYSYEKGKDKNLKDTSHIGGNVEQSSGDNLTQPPNTKTKLSEEEQKVYDHWYTNWRNTQYRPYKREIEKETSYLKVSISRDEAKKALEALKADYASKITREKYDEYFHNNKKKLTDDYNDYIKKKEAEINRVKIVNSKKQQLQDDRNICVEKANEIKKKIFQEKARMKAREICWSTYNTEEKKLYAQKAGNYSIKYSNNKMNYLKL